ncbi:hypothetical protein L484_022127 [Morus notabilis]|uniref:Uncharacterized protein n=1 Tax=Morus notabilis TaxID=981085 RepID=W9QDN8_9ROSA|nr:hypothetical protein L484_022127 [Morus notabilis]
MTMIFQVTKQYFSLSLSRQNRLRRVNYEYPSERRTTEAKNPKVFRSKIRAEEKPARRYCSSKCCRNSRGRSSARPQETGRRELSRVSSPQPPSARAKAKQSNPNRRPRSNQILTSRLPIQLRHSHAAGDSLAVRSRIVASGVSATFRRSNFRVLFGRKKQDPDLRKYSARKAPDHLLSRLDRRHLHLLRLSLLRHLRRTAAILTNETFFVPSFEFRPPCPTRSAS